MGTHLTELTTGRIYELDEFNLIGRSDEATIKLEKSDVSRQHATIRREGGHYWLVDLGSANGTYVNDAALTAARVLRTGDRVQFGANVMIFNQEDGEHQPMSEDVGMTTQVLRRAPTKLVTRPVTLLVADIKGFTTLSAQISSEQVANLLREWYADCNTIMRQQGATIDKFIGDCVFAYWNGTEPDIRAKAVEAARALRSPDTSSSATRQMLQKEMNIAVDCRVGLHVGEAAMGAMGKGINTALGDSVNLAFRIEALTRQLDAGVLASAAFVVDWVEGRDLFEPRGSHTAKGHPDQLEVFALKEA